MRPALMSIGDTAHAAKDSFGDIDVGHFGAPGGWPVQRFSPQSSLRHVCPTIVIIGHTEYAQKRGKLKKPYCTDRPYSRKSTSWSNRPAAPLARPNMPRPANPRRRRGASGRPQAPRACADSRPRGASGDGGPRDGNDRFSKAYRDAGLAGGLGCAPRHPATPCSETCKMGAGRVSRTGSSASSRKARALWLTEADKPCMGPLGWPARRPHGPPRWARFPVPSPIGHGLSLFESNREVNA